ncbi:hypothetical protein PO902_17785 (plasmid) [Planococcus maritimus]|nr:hypothetical protein [Planococcus sp. SK3692]MDE4086902.1 hypothetical protein [Planococcus maritimus]
MKKGFSVMFALLLTLGMFSTFTDEVSAAGTTVTLQTNQTSASTVRVNVNQHLTMNVYNSGSQRVSYRVFKNGVAQTGYLSVSPGARIYNKVAKGDGAYSLRIYCESSSGTGCKAGAGIIPF